MANRCHNTLEVWGPIDDMHAAEAALQELVNRFDWGGEPLIERLGWEGEPFSVLQTDAYLRAWFTTRWTPPAETFERFSRDYPSLMFRLAYDDIEGGRLCGYGDFQAGECIRCEDFGFSVGRIQVEYFPSPQGADRVEVPWW